MVLANSRGADVLNQVVTPASFAGPPILAYGQSLGAGNARWLAASAFADRLGAPILGVATDGDLQVALTALPPLRRFWSSDLLAPAPVYYGGAGRHPVFCGPVLVFTDLNTIEADSAAGWAAAAGLVRSTAQHRFGIGLCAVSEFSPVARPPVYVVDQSVPDVSRLQLLERVWKAPLPPTLAQYQLLAAVETARPGAARFYHPSLMGWVLTAQPS